MTPVTVFPDEQVSISVTNGGAKRVHELLEIGNQITDVLELTPKEAIIVNASSYMLEFRLYSHTGTVEAWRNPWSGMRREVFAEQLTKDYSYGQKRGNILNDIVEMRCKRDTRQVQPWAFTVPPILLRMLEASGTSHETFAQAMGYRDGNFYTMNRQGRVERKLKIECPVNMSGKIKNQKVVIDTIHLDDRSYISRSDGMNVEYKIIMTQTKLAATTIASLLNKQADELVDDPIVKAMLSGFDIHKISDDGANTTVEIGCESDVAMAPKPETIRLEYERLLQRCHDWSKGIPLKEAA